MPAPQTGAAPSRDAAPTQGTAWARRGYASARTIRLASGCILGAFLLTHFVNIAVGLVSGPAMDAAWPYLTGVWSNVVGNTVLYGALAIHFGLTLQALYQRRTLQMSGRDAAQLAFGLLFPFLLVSHVVSTEIAPALQGRPITFVDEVGALWSKPPVAGRQLAALAVGWAHGCLGLWYWLRSRSWYGRAAPTLLVLALLVPIAACVGFLEAGKDLARVPHQVVVNSQSTLARASAAGFAIYLALAGSIVGVLLARAFRDWFGRTPSVHVTYPGGQRVAIPTGFTILEASRSGRIPHVAVCGGRGRCSTCRVRVLGPLHALPPPNAAERATLARIRADPDVRLACQLRPTENLAVFPVLAARRPDATLAHDVSEVLPATGIERDVAVLFCDLRSFTQRAERLLPYDAVHILNRYFEVVGTAVEASGGHLDKFIGDGALALFGLEVSAEVASRQALQAAARIARGLQDLNAHLGAELAEPLRIAMGLHGGPAVVGHMGYGQATSLTAIGDVINVASRLEGLAKTLDAEAVISTALVEKAGVVLSAERRAVPVRGRSAPVDVVLVPNAVLLDAGIAEPRP